MSQEQKLDQPVPTTNAPVVEQPLEDIKPLTKVNSKKKPAKEKVSKKAITKPQSKESKMLTKLKKKIEQRQQVNNEIIQDIIKQEAVVPTPAPTPTKQEEKKEEELVVLEDDVKVMEPKESEQIDTTTTDVVADQKIEKEAEKVEQEIMTEAVTQQGQIPKQPKQPSQVAHHMTSKSLVGQVLNRQRFERDNSGYAKAKTNDYFQWQSNNRMKNSKPSTAAMLNTANQVNVRNEKKSTISPNSLLISKRFQ